jgi:hypothetical protein
MEIEAIVGEPVREGRRLGVPMPKLETIYGLLRANSFRSKRVKDCGKRSSPMVRSMRDLEFEIDP